MTHDSSLKTIGGWVGLWLGGLVGVGDRQGCINCAILLSGIGARGVNSEHVENMKMFSCSPT